MPAATPVTVPEDEPTVATPADPELQFPPLVLLSVVVAPIHIFAVPLIAAGAAFTVSVLVAKHPDVVTI